MLGAGIVISLVGLLLFVVIECWLVCENETAMAVWACISALLLVAGLELTYWGQDAKWQIDKGLVTHQGKTYRLTEVKAEYVPVDKKGQANAQEEAAQPGK